MSGADIPDAWTFCRDEAAVTVYRADFRLVFLHRQERSKAEMDREPDARKLDEGGGMDHMCSFLFLAPWITDLREVSTP